MSGRAHSVSESKADALGHHFWRVVFEREHRCANHIDSFDVGTGCLIFRNLGVRAQVINSGYTKLLQLLLACKNTPLSNVLNDTIFNDQVDYIPSSVIEDISAERYRSLGLVIIPECRELG